MATAVVDRSSNKNEQIVHAAEVLGSSKQRQVTFAAIYRGKAKVKSVRALAKSTRLTPKQVLTAGKVLSANELVGQTRVDGETCYEKVPFFQTYRDQILKLARDKAKRDSVPTKRHAPARSAAATVTIRIPRQKNLARELTVDDIDSFSRVKKVPHGLDYVKMPETRFKNGVASILGERPTFKDWGGELRDLSSSHLRLKGRRHSCAIAFKGPGTSGKLVPGKMGKNGDQIQRLAKCPAKVFLIQYWGEIDDSVRDQLAELVQARSFLLGDQLWYGLIDGDDSARMIQAYPTSFGSKITRKRKQVKKK